MAHNEKHPDKANSFHVEGQILREQPECESENLSLAAYVFDKAGILLGNTCIDGNGNYHVAITIDRPIDVELVIGPEGDAQKIRHSSAYSKMFSANEWQNDGTQFKLTYETLLPLSIWRPWWPQRICISGHVRKIVQQGDVTDICPVPYVKVEVFDVDRDTCFWPWLRNRPDLVLDRAVIRVPDLIKQPSFPPRPIPRADPVPELNFEQALTPINDIGTSPLEQIGFNPQPDPPISLPGASTMAFTRVGEASQMDTSIARRVDKLTFTSKRAPWYILPRCFYSKSLVCETTTDCNGAFKCCFSWWPFYFRKGRLSFDSRPDIIIKITQVINGITTVIYMDPYTSTRWNVNNAHIDLFLDNDEVICGNGNCYPPPSGSPLFFTRIGNDEVYQIDQTSGLYNNTSYNNVAYGSSLNIHGQFGDDLTRSDPAAEDPLPYFYYRLSYARKGSGDDDFEYINATLNDTRVDKATLTGQAHKLGPFDVNGASSLYEVRNFNSYYWYNPDWIGIWHSWITENDTGTYILRMEMFDKDGVKLNTASGLVDYRNGAGSGNGIPPAPLPPMLDHCDLVVTLDNKAPIAELTVPSVINDCGVIPWTAVPPLNFHVSASHENSRLRRWYLWYTKGVGSEVLLVSSPFSNNSIANVSNLSVPGNSLLTGLDGTCAFSLRLRALAHIRNGYGFIYHDQDIDAIAIEKCPPCETS